MQRKKKAETCRRIRRLPRCRHLLVLSASVILTTGMVVPTLAAANCSAGENGLNGGLYSAKSVLPFLGDRCVQVKPVEKKPEPPVPNPSPSQHPTTLSGDPQ
jgi:hypothetical protein